MEVAQIFSSDLFGGLAGQNNKLLDAYLEKAMHSIDPEWRSILCPGYSPVTTAEFIKSYEKLFPGGTVENCFIPSDVLGKFSDLYVSLKYYSGVLKCKTASVKNLNARIEFLTHLGFNERKIRKFYDAIDNRYKLFEALHYFIFEAFPLSGTEALILKHHLNYSNEYALSNGEELPEIKNLSNKADVLEKDIARYIFNFIVLLPWFDYGYTLQLTNKLIIISPVYLYRIRTAERSKYLTLRLLALVLSVIYEYDMLTISMDRSNKYYNLAKKELLEANGIRTNKGKLNIKTRDDEKEPGSRTDARHWIALIYKILTNFPWR